MNKEKKEIERTETEGQEGMRVNKSGGEKMEKD